MGMISILGLLMMYGHCQPPTHAVYISVVEINQQEIRVKVFQDDLQDALRNFNPKSPAIRTNFHCGESGELLSRYFSQKLKVEVNDQNLELDFGSCSEEGDSYWITFITNGPEEWHSISVKDNHFMELFPTQSNIIKINSPEQHFCRLSMSQPTCSFEF